MSLPVVVLAGSPYEQGLQHGRALRARIAHNLRVYFERFEREAKLPRAEVLARAGQYLTVLPEQNAAYFEGMRGVAEGGGFELVEVAALNVRYELLYHQYTVKALAGECTSFAVAPEVSASGHMLLGQNWDWIPEVRGAVLRTTDDDGMETLAFTEAGIVGAKIGLNSAGLGLAVNGMTTTDDDWSRLRKPFHVRCYEILRSRDLDAAVQVVLGEERSCSTNYLIGQAPDRVADIEAGPRAASVLGWEDGLLVHANHFVDAERTGVTEPPHPRRPFSCHRQARLGELLRSRLPVAVSDLQQHLKDHVRHPQSLCRHPDPSLPPEQHAITVTSAIMDLQERTLFLTDGQPCRSAYQRFSLAG